MKQQVLSILIALGILVSFVAPVEANQNDVNMQMTIGEIENIVIEYFNEQGIVYKPGSQETLDSFYNLLMNDGNKSIKENKYYHEIEAFAAEYIYRETTDLQSESIAEIRDMTLNDIRNEIIKEEKVNKDLIRNSTDMVTMSYSYSPSLASSYAQNWAKSFNPTYNKYSSDCTNFVSQAIHHGGLPFGNTGATSNIFWHSKIINGKREDSRAWLVAHDFRTYWSVKGRSQTRYTTKSAVNSNATVGDVLSYQYKSTGRVWHSVFVSKKISGNIYICQHTGARLNDLWNNVS